MPLMLRALKLAVLPYGVAFRERRPGLVILVYHRVGGDTRSEIDLPVALFRRQMAYARRYYPITSLDSILNGSWALEQRSDVLAVTFDDGCLEVYEQAFPVLLAYQIPATIYLATSYVESQRPFDFGGYARSHHQPLPLTWSHVREMVDSGLITVGAHTHNHADLTRLAADQVRNEVRRSRDLIEDRLGRTPIHFAYPWGRATPVAKQIVGEAFATAAQGGCAKNPFGNLDPLELWRQPVQQSDGFWLFRLRLKSYLDAEEYFRSAAARFR